MTAPSASPIAVVLGTRPEIIKLAPVIRELGSRAWVIHTGQHYDANLSADFYTAAGLPPPATVLRDVGGTGRAHQIASVLCQLDTLFTDRRPAAVIVQGDTNSTCAGAQAASYHQIPLVHVEAGLRSYDRAMPEELNRLVVGMLADVHCAATGNNVQNLQREGIPSDRIALTGNTIVQATELMLGRVLSSGRAVAAPERPFVLSTIHRPENTDDPDRLSAILHELASLDVPVLLPLHPRTRAQIARFGFDSLLEPLRVTEPVGHEEFLALASHAALLISDSGGVQEECTVLKKPLIVIRNSTERPESVAAGFAHLVQPGLQIGVLARRLLADASLPERLRNTPSPYGDGNAARLIVAQARRLADPPVETAVIGAGTGTGTGTGIVLDLITGSFRRSQQDRHPVRSGEHAPSRFGPN